MMLLVSVVGGQAGASLGQPRPNLSHAQWMEIGVSSSDAVIVGRVRAVRDSMVHVPGFTRGGFVLPPSRRYRHFVDIDVQEVLKGDSIAARIAVVTADDSPYSGTLRRASQDRNQRVMCFLERRPFGWMLAWEFAPSGGALLLHEHERTVDEARALVAAQSVESLATEAPLIIMSEFQRTTSCEAHTLGCHLFGVDSVIAGTIDDQEVRVWCPIWPGLSFAKAILFLRRGAGPWYELLGAHAGIIPVTDREGAVIRRDVEGLLTEIRAASHRASQRSH